MSPAARRFNDPEARLVCVVWRGGVFLILGDSNLLDICDRLSIMMASRSFVGLRILCVSPKQTKKHMQ
jgi:hypothetical protein